MSAATMSVLCADISGSARLFERLPEGEVFYALERCLKRMERVVGVFSGKVIQSSKSELVALFDKAEEACQAAIDMGLGYSPERRWEKQGTLRAGGRPFRWPDHSGKGDARPP